MTCKEAHVLSIRDFGENQVPSILVRKFNELFPDKINPETGGNYELDKLLSMEFIQDTYGFDLSFKKEGDPGYDVWKKNMDYYIDNNLMHRFYAETGEPVVFSSGDAVWFLDKHGNRDYVVNPTLPENERLEMISALSLRMISEKGEIYEPSSYVKNYFNEQINSLNNKLDAMDDLEDKGQTIDMNEYSKMSKAVVKLGKIKKNPLVMKSIITGVTNTVKDYNIQYSEDLIKDEELTDESMGIETYTRDSTQISDDSTIDPEIKKLLNTVIDFEYTKDGFINRKESIFGLDLPQSENQVKNKILSLVSNVIEQYDDNNLAISPYEVMIEKLNDIAKNGDEALRRFLENLNLVYKTKSENDKLAFRVKFFKSFYKGSHTFLLTEVFDKKDKLTLRRVNPDNSQNKSQQMATSFAMGLFASDKEKFSENIVLLQDLTDEDVKILNPTKITKALNTLGIDISFRTVVDMIANENDLSIYGGPKTGTLRSLLFNLGNKNYTYESKGEDVTISLSNAARTFFDIKHGASSLFKKLTDDASGSDLYILGAAEAKFKDDLADSNYNIAGKSTWKYTLMSHMNRELLSWKNGDLTTLKALEHKRIPLVDYLLLKGDSDLQLVEESTPEYLHQITMQRIAKLNLVTNAQLRDKERDNTVEHKKVGEGDLIFDTMYKMFNFLDEMHEKTDKMGGFESEFYKDRSREVILNFFNGDKGGSYGLEGFDRVFNNSTSFDGQNVLIGQKFRDSFVNLFKGEIDTMQKHSDLIGRFFNIPLRDKNDNIIESQALLRQDYLLNNMIPQVHYSTSDIVSENLNVEIDGKFIVLPAQVKYSYDPENIESDGDYDYKIEYDNDGNPYVKNASYKGNKLTKGMINNALWNRFGFFNGLITEQPQIKKRMFFSESNNDEFSRIKTNYNIETLYTEEIEGEPALSEIISDYVMKIAERNFDYFDKMIGNNLSNRNTNIKGSSDKTFIYDFALQNMLNNISMFQLFNGDLAFFKQGKIENPKPIIDKNTNEILGYEPQLLTMEDALKRGPATMTDGLGIYNESIDNSTGITATSATYTNLQGKQVEFNPSTHLTIAIVNNASFGSSKHDSAIETGVKASQMNNPKAIRMYENYAHEIADAQGFSTSESYKNFVSKVFGWTDVDQVHHDNLNKRDYIPTYEDFKWLKKSGRTTQGMKLVGYGHKQLGESGILAPYFIKYAPLPLYPSLTAGSEVDTLRQKMEKDNVHQVIFKSGSKVANLSTTTIHKTNDDGNFDGLKSDMKFNPFTVEYNKFKWQVELPAHFDSENTIGTQHLKNLIANLDLKSDKKIYPYKGEMLTAKQMFDFYQNAIVNQLKSQGRNFLSKYNITFKPDGTVNYNSQEIRDLLISQMDIVADYELVSILMDTDNPLETIPGVAQRLFPILSGFIHKKVGKVRTNTGSVIQVANIGFDRIVYLANSESRIAFLNNDTEIKPPLPIAVSDLKSFEFDKLVLEDNQVNNKLKDAFRDYNKILNKKKPSKEEIETMNNLKEILSKFPIYYHSVENSLIISLNKELTTELSDGKSITTEGHLKINKAKIMLPFASIKKKLNLTYDELVQAIEESRPEWDKGRPGRIDRRIFENLISYRIPNQAISSNDAVEIVGVLPESYGDTAIVYHEITTKAGSDFDVDKLYLMLPSFGLRTSPKVAAEIQNEVYKILKERTAGSSRESASMMLKELLDEISYDNDFTSHQFLDLFNNKKIVSLEIAEEILDFAIENMDKLDSSLNPESEFPLLVAIKNNSKLMSKDAVYKEGESPKGLQNNVVEVMQSILQSEATYDDLMSPLDSSLVKNTIVDVMYEKYVETNQDSEVMTFNDFDKARKLSPMDQVSPMRLIKARVDMLQAKQLVATMANHMTDVPFTQIQGMRILTDLGFGSSDLSKIDMDEYSYMVGDKMVNEDYYKITQLVSYFMNAAVDAAKDNYIIDGNFIGYTSGAAMLLIRSGMHPREVFRLLLDPDILRLTAFKSAQTGLTSGIRLNDYDYDTETLDSYSNNYLRLKTEGFFGNENFTSYKELMDALNTQEAVSKELKLGVWNLLVEAGKELNNDIATSKADSNGGGKNIYEHISILNKMEQQMKSVIGAVREDGTNTVLNKLYKDGLVKDSNELSFDFIHPDDPKINDLTMFGAMNNFSLNLINTLSKGMFIEATDGFRYMINQMNSLMGSTLESNSDNIKRAARPLRTYLLGQSGFELYQADEAKAIEVVTNGMSNLKNLQTNPRTKNNEFIKLLTFNNSTGLIEFPNYKKFNAIDKARISNAFNEAYNQSAVVKRRLNELVDYAFITTNFTPTRFAFNEYIPKSYFTDRGHGYFIKNLLERLNDINPDVYNTWADDALSMMASYNPDYFRLVRNLTTKTDKGLVSPEILPLVPVTDEKILKKVTKNGKFLPFIKFIDKKKIKVEGSKKKETTYHDRLLKLVDIVDGNPVYNTILLGNVKTNTPFMVPGEFTNGYGYLGEGKGEETQQGIYNINVQKAGPETYDYKSPVTKLFGDLPIPNITKTTVKPISELKPDLGKEQKKLIKKLIPLLRDTMEINGQEVTGIQEKVNKIMASKFKANIEIQEMLLMATDIDDLQSRVEQHLKCN